MIAIDNFVVEPWSAGWQTALEAAFLHSFSAARSPQRWDNIYRQAPSGALQTIAVDIPQGMVLGHFGATIHQLGNGARVGQIRDVLTLPRQRHGGRVFRRVAEAFREQALAAGIDFLFGFPAERHGRLGEHVLGYQLRQDWCTWVGGCQDSAPRLGELQEVRDWLALEPLLAARAADQPTAVRRNADFMRWRWASRGERGRVYRSLLAPDDVGYAVVRVDGDQARLLDVALPTIPELARDCWAQLGAHVTFLGARQWSFWCSAYWPESARFPMLGLQPQGTPSGFMPAVWVLRDEAVRAATDWSYCMADCDVG